MPAFNGAIFDMDGLLLDSERVWERAQITVFRELDLELTLEMQRATTGIRMAECFGIWRGFFPAADIDPDRVRRRLLQLVGEEIRSAGIIKPGAIRALELCANAGCGLGLASSSPAEIIAAGLERLGAGRLFGAVVSSESESHGKPHPAVYLSAARQLGVAPETCIAFEDSVPGIQSAKSAGMYVVAVPEEHNRGRLEYGIADRVISSLESFGEADLAG